MKAEITLTNGSKEPIFDKPKQYKHYRKAGISGYEKIIGVDILREMKAHKHSKHKKSRRVSG